MRRVWFGGSSAPWALQDEIDHTLLDVNSRYPTDEAEVEAYMDDVIGGAQTNESRDELHSTSSAALKVKGMQENPVKVLKNGQDGRVLGYDYEGSNDTIAVASSSSLSTTPCPTTRRELRSFVARFHDPMGLQCEALMCIKYVLQDAESSSRNENDLLKEYDETSSDTKPLTYRVHEWQCHLRSSAPFPRQVKWEFSGQTIFVSTDACVRGWAVIVETDTCGTRLFGRCGVFGPTERRSSKWTAPRAELCALLQGFVTVKTLIKQVSGVARCLILTDSRLNYHRLTREKPKNGWVAWEVTRLRSIVALNDDIQSSGVCLYVSHIPGTLNSADAASRGLFPLPASNVLSDDVTSTPLKQQKQHYLEKALTEIDEQPVAGNAGIIDPRRGKYDSNGDGVGNYMLPEEESCLYEILDTPTKEGCILTSNLTASDGRAPAKAQFGQAFDSLLSRLFRYRLLSDVFVLWRQATESAASSVIVRPARFDILELLVRDAQREDSETTCILQAVRRGDTTLSPFYDVESDPDLLVRLCRHSVNGEVYRQLYVPSKSWALQRLLVMRYHSCGGHQGSVRTKARLASRFFFRRMGCLVSRVVRSCRVCAPLKDERRRSGYGIKSLDSLDVWTCVAADGVGPLRVPVRDDGTESDLKLMVVTDLVSGYVDAEIVDGFTARESAESLLSVFWRRGYPRLLLVDNHMGFRSRTFRSVMNAHNVRIHHTPPNAPTMNAVAERSHGVLLHGLRCALSLGKHQSVEAALPEVLYIMNSRERLGASPFSLMHCRLPRLPGLPDPDIHPKGSSDDLCPLPLSRAARLREKHTVRIQDVIARWEDYRDSLRGSHRGVRQFTVGDKVWVFSRSGGAAKLGRLYRGPFLVHAVSRMGAVVVLGTDKGYEVHAGSNCKLSLAAGDASTPYNPPFGDSSLDVKDFMQRATAAAK
ncbi:hypothetical protein FOZ61_001759 [Perkinsus olseni]|uniref:Integrase catalytic domain-containing protein n=1 Tax=Perkinsus olseni TaxID=32597 RepID=A0A7J6KR71_PEROL|nr:hypothetical protein FOZ61_001759 [Perkinsus olseni]